MTLCVAANAKINWFLKLLGRRPDGYHEIVTLLQTIDLHDVLSFELLSDDRLTLTTTGLDVPQGEDNLVLKAARLLQSRTGCRGARIDLDKRIPSEAGLGGGSSDAAVTLLALNQLWGCGWSRPRLARLAATLGSDVSFFLWGGTALGTGRGERIELVEDVHPDLELLLVLPGFPTSTSDVYRHVQRRSTQRLTSPEEGTRIQPLLTAVRIGNWSRIGNDLEPAALAVSPGLKPIRDAIRRCGADVFLCGSGSTLWAVGAAEALQEAEDNIGRLAGVKVLRCRVVPRHGLWSEISIDERA